MVIYAIVPFAVSVCQLVKNHASTLTYRLRDAGIGHKTHVERDRTTMAIKRHYVAGPITETDIQSCLAMTNAGQELGILPEHLMLRAFGLEIPEVHGHDAV